MENISFVDQNFINQFPLNETNIIEYFSTSPFYDKSSNNEVIKMQTLYSGNKVVQRIDTFKGIYFILEHKNEENTLFIIRKSNFTGQEHIHLNFYYVIHGHIYESPTLSSLFYSKTTEIFFNLNKLLDSITESLCFDPLSLEETKTEEPVKSSKFAIVRDIFDVFNKNNTTKRC